MATARNLEQLQASCLHEFVYDCPEMRVHACSELLDCMLRVCPFKDRTSIVRHPREGSIPPLQIPDFAPCNEGILLASLLLLLIRFRPISPPLAPPHLPHANSQ